MWEKESNPITEEDLNVVLDLPKSYGEQVYGKAAYKLLKEVALKMARGKKI